MVGAFRPQAGYRLSVWQLCLLVLIASIAVTPFNYDDLYGQLGRDIWIAPLLQALVAAASIIGVAKVVRTAGERTLFELVRGAWGTWPARVYCLLLALGFTAWGPISDGSVVSTTVRSTLAPMMPSAVVVVPMVLGALYAAALGPEIVARVTEVWAWLLVPIIAIAATVPWLLARWMYLWPPYETRPVAFTPDLWSFAVAPHGFAVCLALCGCIRQAGRLPRPVLAAAATGWALSTLIYLQPSGLMPSTAAANLITPTLTAMDAVNAESMAIESFIALAVPAWFALSFVVLAFVAWAASEMVRQALGLRDRRWPLALVVLVQLLPAWGHVASLAPRLIPELSLWTYGVAVVAPWLLAASLRRGATPKAVL